LHVLVKERLDCIDDLKLHVRQSRHGAQGARQRWFHVLDLVSTSLQAGPGNPCSDKATWMPWVTPAHRERGQRSESDADYPAAILAITAMDGGK
jgi:hypothetical protein